MIKIGLQNKTKASEGTIETFWFSNESIGLTKTLFHRITIPLEPFDSGLDYVEQPERTEVIVDWINLGQENPSHLAGVEINSEFYEEMEATIYIGSAHNLIYINSLKLTEVSSNTYEIDSAVIVEFENEGIGKNENFRFKTIAVFVGQIE